MKTDFTAQIPDDVAEKFFYIAQKEGRTPNNHFIYMLRQNIAYYERVHGKISESELSKMKNS